MHFLDDGGCELRLVRAGEAAGWEEAEGMPILGSLRSAYGLAQEKTRRQLLSGLASYRLECGSIIADDSS